MSEFDTCKSNIITVGLQFLLEEEWKQVKGGVLLPAGKSRGSWFVLGFFSPLSTADSLFYMTADTIYTSNAVFLRNFLYCRQSCWEKYMYLSGDFDWSWLVQ